MLQPNLTLPTAHSALTHTSGNCSPVTATPNNPLQVHPQPQLLFICQQVQQTGLLCPLTSLALYTLVDGTAQLTTTNATIQPANAITCPTGPSPDPDSQAHQWELQPIRELPTLSQLGTLTALDLVLSRRFFGLAWQNLPLFPALSS